MQQQDLQQIKQILKEEFKENNKKLKKDIVNEVGAITNQGFGEFKKKTGERFNKMDKKFDKMDKELEKKPNKNHMFGWADKKIHNLELDMDKAKFTPLDKMLYKKICIMPISC